MSDGRRQPATKPVAPDCPGSHRANAAARLRSPRRLQGNRPDPARTRRRSRSGDPGGRTGSAPVRRCDERDPVRRPGPAVHPVRGPHGLPAFRAPGRPAGEHPVARPGRAPDAALAHRRRGRARARVEPEHAGPGGGPCADEPRRHGPAHVCDLPGGEPERAANPRCSPGRDGQHPADVVRLWLETGGGSVAPGRPSRSGAVSAPFPSPGAVQPGERHHRLPGPRFGSADRRGRSSAAGHAGGADPATEGRARLRILGRHSAVAAHAADEQSLLGRRHRRICSRCTAAP